MSVFKRVCLCDCVHSNAFVCLHAHAHTDVHLHTQNARAHTHTHTTPHTHTHIDVCILGKLIPHAGHAGAEVCASLFQKRPACMGKETYIPTVWFLQYCTVPMKVPKEPEMPRVTRGGGFCEPHRQGSVTGGQSDT